MKKLSLTIGCFGVLIVTACSGTPSRPPFPGQPFVEVAGISPEEIQSRFSVNCLDGGRIVASSQYSVTCARPMGGSVGELAYRALLTERNASNPDLMLQTAWAKTSQGTIRVTATLWVEHQSAFGKTTRNDLAADETKYQIQESLNTFKRNVEGSKPVK